MTRLSSVGTQFDLTLEPERAKESAGADPPFRLLLVGDFTGRGSRGDLQPKQIAKRRPIGVDRDNFDAVIGRWGVELALPDIPGAHERGGQTVRFDSLDSFHPDALVKRLALFDALASIAKKSESQGERDESPAASAAAPHRAAPADAAGLLDQILGGASGPLPQSEDDWQRYVQAIVAPHLVDAPDESAIKRSAKFEAIGARMLKSVLHAPAFRALEAAWRGIDQLVRRAPSDAAIKIHLLDVTREELAADLATDDLTTAGLYRLLVEQAGGAPGAQPWTVVAGLYEFGPAAADVELLGRLVLLAGCAGAPFLAGATLAFAGCRSLADAQEPRDWRDPFAPDARQLWQAIRALPESAYLGLATPRPLVRLPYGKKTEPCQSFRFEEIEGPPKHEDFLWGPPAIVLACLLIDAFAEDGWRMRPGNVTEIGDAPLYTYDEMGNTLAWPCAEASLGERAAEALLDRGLMPLLAPRGQDTIRVARFQSIADPPRPLAGRWS